MDSAAGTGMSKALTSVWVGAVLSWAMEGLVETQVVKGGLKTSINQMPRLRLLGR